MVIKSKDKYFEAVFNALPDPSVIMDEKGRILDVNDAYIKILQARKKTLLGKSFMYFFPVPEDVKDSMAAEFITELKENQFTQFETFMPTGKGAGVWVKINAASMMHQGQMLFVVNLHDISDRRKIEDGLRKSGEKLRSIFQSVSDGIVVLDMNGLVTEVNQRALAIGGYSSGKEVLGKKFMEMMETDGDKIKHALLSAVKNGAVHGIELKARRKTGAWFFLEINASILRTSASETQGYIIVLRDITDRKEAEDKLKKSEDQLRDLFDNANDLITSVDAEGKYLYVNQKWLETLGYSADEVSHLTLKDVIHPKHFDDDLEKRKKLLNGDTIDKFESVFVTKDGRDVYVEGSLNGKFEDGKFIASRGIFHDVTEERQAEELYQDVVNSAPVGIYIVQNKRFVLVNPEFEHITGYSREVIIGRESLSIVYPQDRQLVRDDAIQMLKGRISSHHEFRILRRDAEVRWAMETAVSISYNGARATLGNLIDITERKEMEAELQDKVQELQAANQRLKELDKLKDGFLSTVSHELRTPLTSIKSFAEILLTYDEDRATQKEFLGIINEESERLTRLINDFLDLSKIQSGRMQWDTNEVDIKMVIENALTANHSQLLKANLVVTTDIAPGLPVVWSDKDRLIQVVTNLLSNAIKFTREGGQVNVSSYLDKKDASEPDMVVVSITDTGIGIAPENHQIIFEKFTQVGDTLKDRPRGTGLGLPICCEIVEHYGGKLWVESQLGRGATFFFTLPVVQKAKVGAVTTNGKTPPSTGSLEKIILVVDDETNIRRLISHELTNRGYKVVEASGGKEAIELARKLHPDLITMDVVMPDIDGFDVTAVLKNDAVTKGIPILIISVIEDKAKGFRLGANDYISKPFNIEALLERVSKLLTGSQKIVLVVDDDKSLVKSIEIELKRRGFTTFSAFNGKEALQTVAQNRPDLILLDIKMPEMDGYEVISNLKNRPETSDIHIVLMTGVDIDGGRVKALSIGAADYFNKSEELNKLFEAIENILSSGNKLRS